MRSFSQNQRRLIRSILHGDNSYVLAYGASGSGKTAAAVAGFLYWALEHHQDRTFAVVAKTSLQSRQVVGNEMERFCQERGVRINVLSRHATIAGNTFLFLDGANIQARERIQGLDLGGVYIDEVVNLNPAVFEELDQRARAGDTQKIVMTANPSNVYHWFKKDYYDRADEIGLARFHLLHSDNPGLSSLVSERMRRTAAFSRSLTARRIEGIWANPSGQIYPHYDIKRIHPSVVSNWYLAIDPADASTTHALLIGKYSDDGDKYTIAREWVHDGRANERLSHSDQIARIAAWLGDVSVDAAVVDSAAAAFQTQLEQTMGVPVYAAIKDVEQGIEQTGYVLYSGALSVSPDCRNLIGELQGYHWDEKAALEGVDKPVKLRDHGVDAMRYFVMTLMGVGSNEWSIRFTA